MPQTVLYLLNKTDGSNAFVIQPSTFDGSGGVQRNTDLTLYGNGTPSWGERFDDNFYHLLENFAVQEQTGTLFIPETESTLGAGYGINKPILGQIWYNETRQQLFIQTETGNSSGWSPINNVLVATSLTPSTVNGQPFTPRVGELAYNTTTASLELYNGTTWVNAIGGVVNQIVAGTGITISPTSGVGTVTINSSASGGTVSSVTIVESSGPTGASGLVVSGSPIITSGTITLTLSQELTGLSQLSSAGFVVRTGTGVYTPRLLTGGIGIAISNAAGATGNPIISLGIVPIGNGGTGEATAAAGFNALSPILTTGDLIVGNGANSATRLAIGSVNTILQSTGTTAHWTAITGLAQTSVVTTSETTSAGQYKTSSFLSISLLANSYYSFELYASLNPYTGQPWIKVYYTGTVASSSWLGTFINNTGAFPIPGGGTTFNGSSQIIDNATPVYQHNAFFAGSGNSPANCLIKGFVATGTSGTLGLNFGQPSPGLGVATLLKGSYLTALKVG